jgi:hypothetical protein
MSTRMTAQRPARLIAGADVNATTHDGASALDIARVAGARRRAADPAATGGEAPEEVPDGDPLSRPLPAAGATH